MSNDQGKTKISVRVDSDMLKKLSYLYYPRNMYNTTGRIEALMRMTMTHYNDGMRRIEGIFTYYETALLCQAFNSFLMSYSAPITFKEVLMSELADFVSYECPGFFSDEKVDTDKLLKKVEGLDDWQALCVINSILEFWERSTCEDAGQRLGIEDLFMTRKETAEAM